MNGVSRSIRVLRPIVRRLPLVKSLLRGADERLSTLRHSLAAKVPALIRPAPRQITIAVTASCNLRCVGCRYGRDFMPGHRLEEATVRGILDDARAAGVSTARFYGGEPLLHPDLPAMIAHAKRLGLDAYITTNGTLLAQRIDELYRAGLRWMTIGFYGTEAAYDEYTQRPEHFARLREGISAVRQRYGSAVEIQINLMLSRRSCSLEAVQRAWSFAREFDLFLGVDPVSRTIPFFTDPDGALGLEERDRPALAEVVRELVRLKSEFPDRVPPSLAFLSALPDLMLDDAASRIPCDAYQLLWVGADGTVQLCDVHFKLGNVHERRLREMLFTKAHCQAARDGFQLKCPTCMCKIDSRIRKHASSLRSYRP